MSNAFSKLFYKLAVAGTSVVISWTILRKIEPKMANNETSDTEFNFAAEVEARESEMLLIKKQQRLDKFMPIFSELMATNRFALYDLLRKCKKNEYQVHGVNLSILKHYNLLNDKGNVNNEACAALLDSTDKDRNYNKRRMSYKGADSIA